MKYFNVVVLNDGETFSGIKGSSMIQNAFEDECSGQLGCDEASTVIPIQDLVDLYVRIKSLKPTSPHSSWELACCNAVQSCQHWCPFA